MDWITETLQWAAIEYSQQTGKEGEADGWGFSCKKMDWLHRVFQKQ